MTRVTMGTVRAAIEVRLVAIAWVAYVIEFMMQCVYMRDAWKHAHVTSCITRATDVRG